MKVVYTEAHLGHNPQEEIAESGSHSPHEHTARAENIREVLQADKSMQFLAPTEWGVDPINAVHNPGLNNFLTSAWADYQREVRPSREVVPDFFYRPSMREAMTHTEHRRDHRKFVGCHCHGDSPHRARSLSHRLWTPHSALQPLRC